MKWDLIIESKSGSRFLNLTEIVRYRDLIMLFVKRDFIALYKQTILGPIWVVLQPILTSFTFAIVFGKIAQIQTGAPAFLFYLLGVTFWTFYSDCVIKTSETFISNQNLFGKVYFPRLVVPISIVITNLIKFIIQISLFVVVYSYFFFFTDSGVELSFELIFLPVSVLIMAIFGLGTGLIISALTTKYRDLRFLIQFGIQLAMFATPIVYPLSNVDPEIQWILQLNPMCPVIETAKVGFFGPDFASMNVFFFFTSFLTSCSVFLIGSWLFNRVEKNFMDTI